MKIVFPSKFMDEWMTNENTNENCSLEFYPWNSCASVDATFSWVQSLSCVQLFATPWTAAHQGSLSITSSWSLLKFMSINQVGYANQLSYPLLSPSFPAFNLSYHKGLFQWVSSLHQMAKILELQHQSFQWIFRTDFL